MSEIHCKHYRYPANDCETCGAGVVIRATFKTPWPCYGANKVPPSSHACDKFVAYTPEELAERKREGDAAIQRMLAANQAVGDYEEEHGASNVVRTIPCPTCQQPLKFARSARHRYVECETPKCTSFRGTMGR